MHPKLLDHKIHENTHKGMTWIYTWQMKMVVYKVVFGTCSQCSRKPGIPWLVLVMCEFDLLHGENQAGSKLPNTEKCVVFHHRLRNMFSFVYIRFFFVLI